MRESLVAVGLIALAGAVICDLPSCRPTLPEVRDKLGIFLPNPR